MILILDLDGVLITTPQWKPDEIDRDGYSVFNKVNVEFFNMLLGEYDFEIWLSSTRRTNKSLKEFNNIFKNRGIINQIIGFLPNYTNCKNRREEIELFLEEKKSEEYLIIDDDKSLNGLKEQVKRNLVLTEYLKGFDSEKLKEALKIIESKT